MDNSAQKDIYIKRNDIKKDIMPFQIKRKQITYLRNFFSINKKEFRNLFLLMTFLIAIEIFIPISLKIFLSEFDYSFNVQKIATLSFVTTFTLLLYVYVNYLVIKKQKTLVIYLINKIRKDLFNNILTKSPISLSKSDKNRFTVKISYHLSLLQMGLNSSLLSFTQVFFYLTGLLIVSLILDIKLFIIAVLLIPLNFLIFYISYIVSIKYLSKDQTLYSKILGHMISGLDNFYFIKENSSEKKLLDDLNELVELDNFFRIRREILLKMGNVIIFSLITLFSVILFVFSFTIPQFQIISIQNSIALAAFTFLSLRLINSSLRIGLFYFPLKLGLILCVPEIIIPQPSRFAIKNFKEITFKTNKTKFSKKGDYYKNISLTFNIGNRYMIKTLDHTVSKQMAEIISGLANRTQGVSWLLKIDNKRMLYKKWFESKKSTFYISPYFEFETVLFDVLDEKHNLNEYSEYDFFNFIFDNDKFTGQTINKTRITMEQTALVQIMHCLIRKPDIVVVDTIWNDMNSEKIQKALDLLHKINKNSILIETSSGSFIDKNYKTIYNV
jgi:ABC-type multidrug transport system fused ATPase/permease subunit